MFRAIEHTAIATPDPEKLAAWYVDILGFRVNHRYRPNVFVRAPGGGVLELIPADKGDCPEQRMFQAGIRHLAITADDFDAAHRLLQSRGVNFLTEPTNVGGNRLVFFTDADGNYLHLVSRPAPLP